MVLSGPIPSSVYGWGGFAKQLHMFRKHGNTDTDNTSLIADLRLKVGAGGVVGKIAAGVDLVCKNLQTSRFLFSGHRNKSSSASSSDAGCSYCRMYSACRVAVRRQGLCQPRTRNGRICSLQKV